MADETPKQPHGIGLYAAWAVLGLYLGASAPLGQLSITYPSLRPILAVVYYLLRIAYETIVCPRHG